MKNEDTLLELRFDQDASDCVQESAQILRDVNAEVASPSRDPMIVAAMTIAGAAISLSIELIKLARELRQKEKKRGILVVRLNDKNEEISLSLLEATDADIEAFVGPD